MKLKLPLIALVVALLASSALAQAPAPVPSAGEKPSTGKRLFDLKDQTVKTIALCTPLNVLVKTGDRRSVYVDSGPDAVPVDVAVSPRSELVISTLGSFETSAVPVKIIATIPEGELEGVSISPSGGAMVVEGPVSPKSGAFNVSSVNGAADLVVNGVRAEHVFLASSGASRVFLLNDDAGAFPDAKVGAVHAVAGGTSSAFVFGPGGRIQKVDVLLEGSADAAVDISGGEISGVALGDNAVFFTPQNSTTCAVGAPLFRTACVPTARLTSKLGPQVFSCGLAAVGPFSCPTSQEKGQQGSAASAAMGASPPAPAPSPSTSASEAMAMAMAPSSPEAGAPSPSAAPEIATGGRRLSQAAMRGAGASESSLSSSSQASPSPHVPVLVFHGSIAFMRRCDAPIKQLAMAGAKPEESA